MIHFQNILVPIAIFFLLYKLFMNKKPTFLAMTHCLMVFLIITFLHYFLSEFLENPAFLPMRSTLLLNALLFPSIFFYILFFRENRDYDELLKKDIWQHWTDEPVHKKEG